MSGYTHDQFAVATSDSTKGSMEVENHSQIFKEALNPYRYRAASLVDGTTDMSPGGTKKRKTSAQEKNEQLRPADRELLTGIINGNYKFVPQPLLDRVAAMFSALDTSGDGKLQAEDFVYSLPRQRQIMLSFWQTLQDACDFDGDGEVDAEEFVGFFVFHALEQPCILPSNQGGSVGQVLESVKECFIKSFENVVKHIEDTLNNLG